LAITRLESIVAGACGAHGRGVRRRHSRPRRSENDDGCHFLQSHGVGGRNAEAATAAAATCPEQIRVLLRVGMNRATVRADEVHRQQAVAGQSERPRQVSIAAAEQMAGHADGRAAAAGEGQFVGRDSLIQSAERSAGADACRIRFGIDVDRVHHAGVDDDAGALRKAFVRVAAAPYREWQVGAAAPIDHDGDGFDRLAHRP
jgi:hypothetical protein